jgi:hypothetical protein
MSHSTHEYRRGTTCQISAFEVLEAPRDPDHPPRTWMAVATAHVYDVNAEAPPLTPAQVVLAGQTLQVVTARAFADTEAEAMTLALKALQFQLTARANRRVDPPWQTQ